MPIFHDLAIQDSDSFYLWVVSVSRYPEEWHVNRGGLVYPELNFTLPGMIVDASSMPEVRKEYTQMITGGIQKSC